MIINKQPCGILALKDGLDLCIGLDLTNVAVECDSQIVVNAIKMEYISHWRIQYAIPQCLNRFSLSFTIQHRVRQTNMVVDKLSTWPQQHKSSYEFFYRSWLSPLCADCFEDWSTGIMELSKKISFELDFTFSSFLSTWYVVFLAMFLFSISKGTLFLFLAPKFLPKSLVLWVLINKIYW